VSGDARRCNGQHVTVGASVGVAVVPN